MTTKFRTVTLTEGIDLRESGWKTLLAGLVYRRDDVDLPDGELRMIANRGRPCFTVKVLGEVDDAGADRIAEELRAAGDDLLRRRRRLTAVAALDDFERFERQVRDSTSATRAALTTLEGTVTTIKTAGDTVQAGQTVVAAARAVISAWAWLQGG